MTSSPSSLDHPTTAAQADTEAMALMKEASKAFSDDTFRTDIESKLKGMTAAEQSLMAAAFQRTESSPAGKSAADKALPQVNLVDTNNELRSISFTGTGKDNGHAFTLQVREESDASIQKRHSQGATEVAEMLKHGNITNANNRMLEDIGKMPVSDWVTFMKQISTLAPDQLKLLTPSDIGRMTPSEQKDLALSAGLTPDQMKNSYAFTLTQPRLYGLLGHSTDVIAAGMVMSDPAITKAAWMTIGTGILYNGPMVESNYNSIGLPK